MTGKKFELNVCVDISTCMYIGLPCHNQRVQLSSTTPPIKMPSTDAIYNSFMMRSYFAMDSQYALYKKTASLTTVVVKVMFEHTSSVDSFPKENTYITYFGEFYSTLHYAPFSKKHVNDRQQRKH